MRFTYLTSYIYSYPIHLDSVQFPSNIFETMKKTSRTICVGDLHGNIKETKELYHNLRSFLGDKALSEASLIFLGDYVDRGPESKQVLDFLIRLKEKRPKGKTHFVSGNHDFGMACFVGCTPSDNKDLSAEKLDATRNPKYTSGFYKFDVKEGMHYQGRRWGGSMTYSANTTFQSYGVDFEVSEKAREKFIDAVPKSHKTFLKELKWVHEEDTSFPPGKIICT